MKAIRKLKIHAVTGLFVMNIVVFQIPAFAGDSVANALSPEVPTADTVVPVDHSSEFALEPAKHIKLFGRVKDHASIGDPVTSAAPAPWIQLTLIQMTHCILWHCKRFLAA